MDAEQINEMRGRPEVRGLMEAAPPLTARQRDTIRTVFDGPVPLEPEWPASAVAICSVCAHFMSAHLKPRGAEDYRCRAKRCECQVDEASPRHFISARRFREMSKAQRERMGAA